VRARARPAPLLGFRAVGEETTTAPRPASLVLLAFVAAASRARAAERREPPLGEVVVTAPPVPEAEPAGDPTAFHTTIEADDAPTRVETLAEALADSVGVQVRRFGGLGEFSTVSVRGYAAGQVQVYLDGVPLSRADNETVNLADLPLDAVERVDVYRGATPLAFAQSGPGGVVNVVTRRPGATPLTAASASYGSFTTRKADVVRSARAGAWEYLAFGHYQGSAGNFEFERDPTPDFPGDEEVVRRRNAGFDLGDVTGRVGWRGGPWAVSLTSDTFARDGGVPGVGVAQAEDTRLRTLRQLAHLRADLDAPGALPLTASAGAWVVHEAQRFEDPKGELLAPTDTTNRSTAAGAQLLLRGALGTHQVPGLLLAGGHERFAVDDRLDPRPAPPDRTRVRGTVAAEDEVLLLGERLAVVPGLRWELVHDDFPGAAGARSEDFLTPRLGVRATPVAAVTLLGNVGRYARVPNLTELFGDRGAIRGNSALRPEEALNGDVGFRLTPPPHGPLAHVALEYAYFDNTIDDLIVLVQQSQGIVRPENVTAARIRGHEVAARARLWARVGVVANYTHQDARDVGDVPSLRGTQLPGRPADEGYGRLELSWSARHPLPLAGPRLWPGRLYYETNVIGGNALDRANLRHVGSRVLHEVGADVRLPVGGLRLGVEVKNLGDDRTADALGFPLPGRAVFGTVSWGFGRRDDDDAVR
jgi:iron complex outermembrane receptor protein